jgi:hypothetical protein
MYTGKWVWRLIAVTVIASSAACGGGGSGEATPGTGEIHGDLPNMGLQGTLYYNGNSGFESIDLANPVIKNMGVGFSSLFTLSSSFDGQEHVLIGRTDDVFAQSIDVMDNGQNVTSSFTVEVYPTGEAKLSPNGQFIAVGVDPTYIYPYGRERELRIYDRNGTLLRDFEDDEDNNWVHSDWAWTQDGRLLVSFSKRGLYILDDVLGSQFRFLQSFNGTTPISLAVSPDNTQIAFWLYTDRQLFIMNLDGTGLRQVTRSEKTSISQGISWSPDGRFLAVRAFTDSPSSCWGRATLIVRSDAQNAELPDISAIQVGDGDFQSTNVFFVEYVSDSGSLLRGPCMGQYLSWR